MRANPSCPLRRLLTCTRRAASLSAAGIPTDCGRTTTPASLCCSRSTSTAPRRVASAPPEGSRLGRHCGCAVPGWIVSPRRGYRRQPPEPWRVTLPVAVAVGSL